MEEEKEEEKNEGKNDEKVVEGRVEKEEEKFIEKKEEKVEEKNDVKKGEKIEEKVNEKKEENFEEKGEEKNDKIIIEEIVEKGEEKDEEKIEEKNDVIVLQEIVEKNEENPKDDEVFLAPENESQMKEESSKENEINYKNLLPHDPKTKIEILDNISGDNYDINFKIIVIGNSGVGKSSLTLKATQGVFKEDFTSTVGFQFFSFHVKINDKIIKLQIWDTCGQEIYRSLINNFYRSTALALICYSVNDRKSFEEADIWLKQVKMNSDPNCKVFLIANKIDLPDRVVSSEEGIKYKKENGFECFIETSAKSGLNVKELFVNCALSLYKELSKYKKGKEFLEAENENKKLNLKAGVKTEEKDCSC